MPPAGEGCSVRRIAPLVLLAVAGCRKPEPSIAPARLEVLEEHPLAALGAPVRTGALHSSGLVAGGTEAGSVIVADARGRRVLGAPRVHRGPVTALHFSGGGSHLLSVGGELAIWWSLASAAPERQVKGPQRLSAGLLREGTGGAQAYLGTALGAVIRWPLQQRATEPLPWLACPAFPVLPARRRLPGPERCPFGSFVEASDGSGAACVYPVTAMALDGETLWRACREGSLRAQPLRPGAGSRGYGAGFLRTLTPWVDGLLVLGRDDGELRLLDSGRWEQRGSLQPGGAPGAAASSGKLLAVAQDARVRIWVGGSRQASAEVAAAARVVALALERAEVRYLLEDGRALGRALRPAR